MKGTDSFKKSCQKNYQRLLRRVVFPGGITKQEKEMLKALMKNLTGFADVDIPTVCNLFGIKEDQVKKILECCRLKIKDKSEIPMFKIIKHSQGLAPEVVVFKKGVHGFLDS
ncbi:MAG: hypothetical protein V1928_04820 [Parcubacteria group bacterium]